MKSYSSMLGALSGPNIGRGMWRHRRVVKSSAAL